MQRNAANALHHERHLRLSKYYYDLKSTLLSLPTHSFASVKAACKAVKVGLVHSWPCRYESKEEFYDCFFEIILQAFSIENYLSQKLDIMCLYIFYSTIPHLPQIKIHLSSADSHNLKRFILTCKQNEEREILEILHLLYQRRAFIHGVKSGLRTTLIDKFGHIRKEKELSKLKVSYSLDQVNFNSAVFDSSTIKKLEADLRKYTQTKESYLSEFVKNDDEEPIMFDTNSKKIIKSSEMKLNLLDKQSAKESVNLIQKFSNLSES